MSNVTKVLLPEGITRAERTEKLNTAMRNVVPSICIERAKLYTESYKATEGMPGNLQRAYALRHLLENMTIFIDEDELVIGNHGSRPRAALMFPEFGTFSKKELDLMPVRKVDTLQLSKEDEDTLLNDIYPYWKGKSLCDQTEYYVDADIMKVLDSENRVFNPLSRTRSGYGHYLPNINKVLKVGFKGIEDQVKGAIENLDIAEPDYAKKKIFYRSMLVIIDGIHTFQNRYADLAEKEAKTAPDERRKKELLMIAQNCRRVPYYPAENFWEALQSYWFVILVDYCSQNGSAISGGRVDQMFYPYYKKDIESGRMCREEAGELLEALWVKHSDIIKAGTYMSARNNGGFATTVNVVLGGVDENGNDAVNDLSYLCLDAEEHVFNSEPNTSIRLSSKNPDQFAEKVLEILHRKEGGKMPFFNDDLVIPALIKDGTSEKDARNYAIVGCVEPTSQGNTMGRTNSCYFNLAKCLELALFDGVDMMTGRQMGPKTGKAEDFTSFDQVVKAYNTQVDYFVKYMVSSLNSISTMHAKYGHVYSSMLLDGCIEKGIDCTEGGAKYDYSGVNGVGMADVADSLEAIRDLVFEKKQISMQRLLNALKTNFESDPILQHILLNKVDKYGNDKDDVDQIAHDVAKQYCDSVHRFKSASGGIYRPGLFCLSSNTPLGRQVIALPSGRLSGTPLGDGGISPKHGMDTNGPTAAAKSVSKLDHAAASNGVNFNLKFVPSVLDTEADREKLVHMIRSYFRLGGMHIQFNVLSSETLKAAQKDPAKYRGLVVRVAGYSAFFVELDTDIQNEIISRTEQTAI